MSIQSTKNKKKLIESNFFVDFFIAGFAATIGKTSTAPLDRVKLILQNQTSLNVEKKPYKGILDCLSRLYKTEGVLSLWRGNVTNVLRYFPNQSINFACKDTFKKYFANYNPNLNPIKFALGNCFSGGLAGSIGLLICHPMDLARTRLATDNKEINGARKFNNSFDCFKKIYTKEGIKGIYNGIVVSVVGIFLYRAAYFGGYDSIKGLFMRKDSGFISKWIIAQSVTICSGLLFYPLDTIRRRIMIESGKLSKDKKYRNAIDCSFKMFKEEKFFGFYKGFGTNALRTMGSSIVLVLYDEFQKICGYSARGNFEK